MTIFSTVDDTSRAGLCRTRASHSPLANNTHNLTIYHHDLFVCFDLLNRPDNPFSETSFLQVFGGYIRSVYQTQEPLFLSFLDGIPSVFGTRQVIIKRLTNQDPRTKVIHCKYQAFDQSRPKDQSDSVQVSIV